MLRDDTSDGASEWNDLQDLEGLPVPPSLFADKSKEIEVLPTTLDLEEVTHDPLSLPDV